MTHAARPHRRLTGSLSLVPLWLLAAAMLLPGCGSHAARLGDDAADSSLTDLIFFTSAGKIGVIAADGSGERYLDFSAYDKHQWQATKLIMPNQRQMIVYSQDRPLDPNASFYDPNGLKYARTHLWLYDVGQDRLTPTHVPTLTHAQALTTDGQRLIVTGEPDGGDRTKIFTLDLTGGDRQDLYDAGGFIYGIDVSADGRRMIYHDASAGYAICMVDLDTQEKTILDGEAKYLNFGPCFSPDDRWILYQRCDHAHDAYHMHSDLWLVAPDGTRRQLTDGQSHWFGTAYGPADNHGGGSNIPTWSPDGRWITYTRLTDGARTAWVHRPDRKDTDHFNCDYEPDQATGGSQICLIDSATGAVTELTEPVDRLWRWRVEWSMQGDRMVYARAAVGQPAELWIMDADGSNRRFLTRGFDGQGADFPQWVRLETSSSPPAGE